MAGRTFEFSSTDTEESELAGSTVDMLALQAGATVLSPFFLRVLFTRTSIPLDPRGRVKRRGDSFSQVDFPFLFISV